MKCRKMPTKKSADRDGRRRLSIRARAPRASTDIVRRVMQANTGRTTAPERELRSAAHRLGLRFRVDCRPDAGLRCDADLVFRQSKVCVFVDGCYWHGCPLHFAVPKQNSAWWAEKIDDNRKRDARRTAELRDRGWTVLRFWEHEIQGDSVVTAAARIARTVRRRLARRQA
jgi:DNA mismatch endonuclease (patch repair protein)